jgi:hypothetical protein
MPRGEGVRMPVTVVLEGRGEVPCEVVGRVRSVAVRVPAYDACSRERMVSHETIVVVVDGERRTVAVERVTLDDGTRPRKPVEPVEPREARPRHNACEVVVDGVTYPSLAKACEVTGVAYSVAKWRKRAGYPAAVAVLRWER